jgi:hypothetical protein
LLPSFRYPEVKIEGRVALNKAMAASILVTVTVGEASVRAGQRWRAERKSMTLSTILLIVLVLALVGAVPVWGYNRSWGYAPSGLVGVILLILLILALTGGLNF